jgi:hypothetical protein
MACRPTARRQEGVNGVGRHLATPIPSASSVKAPLPALWRIYAVDPNPEAMQVESVTVDCD